MAKEKESDEPTPPAVIKALKSFNDVMWANLLKNFPPQRDINHKIKLILGMKPLAKAPYRMAPPKLT